MTLSKIAQLAQRAIPFLRDEGAKYSDDGSNEPLELAPDIEAALASHGGGGEAVATLYRDGYWTPTGHDPFDRYGPNANRASLPVFLGPQPRGEGMVLVERSQIEKAIGRAEVFDDGSDGADAESARSVVAILTTALAAAPGEGSGGIPFDTVRKVASALTRLGLSHPEGQEEQAARAVEMVEWLCAEVHDRFDSLTPPPASQSAPSDGPANTRPVSEVVEEWKQDPERKAGLDAARERLGPRPSDGGWELPEGLEWRWVDDAGRAMTNWTASTPPPVLDLSDSKGTMHVEVRGAPTPERQ